MERRFVFTEQQLADKLREAAAAHHGFEVDLGHPDSNWPSWYAQHMVMEMPARPDVQPAPFSILDNPFKSDRIPVSALDFMGVSTGQPGDVQ